MYAITGITGQVGGVVARALLTGGKDVRAVVRDATKGETWARQGCEVALAAMDDPDALRAAFAGTAGVFVLLPPNFDPSSGFPESRHIIAALRRALTSARPERVVVLSTVGAQATTENLLTQLSLMEEALGTLPFPVAYLRREELRAQGKSEEEIKEDVANGYKDGRFKVPGPGFLYMMSNENYVYNSESKKSGFVPPHLMFYAPYKTARDIGYEAVSPTMVPYLTGSGVGPESLLVVVAEKPSPNAATGDSHKH
jgi:putative NADH-flavin reductase